jgi:hypothetical protein
MNGFFQQNGLRAIQCLKGNRGKIVLKMAKTDEKLELTDEPRMRDPVMYNRLRIMIEEEAIKPTWGCPLYIAARKGGWLTEDQKRAGDKYQQIVLDYNQAQASDPNEWPEATRELAYARVKRRKDIWKECTVLLGLGRKAVDRLVLEEITLITQAERSVARDGLQLLSNFFNIGTKGQH